MDGDRTPDRTVSVPIHHTSVKTNHRVTSGVRSDCSVTTLDAKLRNKHLDIETFNTSHLTIHTLAYVIH